MLAGSSIRLLSAWMRAQADTPKNSLSTRRMGQTPADPSSLANITNNRVLCIVGRILMKFENY